MDVFFHGASAALLASALGERRRLQLVLAAIIGILPDLTWCVGRLFIGPAWDYRISHSLLYCALVTLIVLLLNRRIALGMALHLLIDTPLHKPSPLYHFLGVEGIDWYRGWGIAVAVALWLVLIFLIAAHLKAMLRTRAAYVSQADTV